MKNEIIDKLKNAGYITVTDDSQGIADKLQIGEGGEGGNDGVIVRSLPYGISTLDILYEDQETLDQVKNQYYDWAVNYYKNMLINNPPPGKISISTLIENPDIITIAVNDYLRGADIDDESTSLLGSARIHSLDAEIGAFPTNYIIIHQPAPGMDGAWPMLIQDYMKYSKYIYEWLKSINTDGVNAFLNVLEEYIDFEGMTKEEAATALIDVIGGEYTEYGYKNFIYENDPKYTRDYDKYFDRTAIINGGFDRINMTTLGKSEVEVRSFILTDEPSPEFISEFPEASEEEIQEVWDGIVAAAHRWCPNFPWNSESGLKVIVDGSA